MEVWCSYSRACGESCCLEQARARRYLHPLSRDIALGNTFGGTALSSYGGFWISIGIILTPGGFEIETSYGPESNGNFYAAFGL